MSKSKESLKLLREENAELKERLDYRAILIQELEEKCVWLSKEIGEWNHEYNLLEEKHRTLLNKMVEQSADRRLCLASMQGKKNMTMKEQSLLNSVIECIKSSDYRTLVWSAQKLEKYYS